MSFERNKCIAAKYFPEKCQGKHSAEPREIAFNYADFAGNQLPGTPSTTEHVDMCHFHYTWLKTMWPLEMHGETVAHAVTDDLLARFKDRQIFQVWRRHLVQNRASQLYLLEGNENTIGTPLKSPDHTWELEGTFCYDDYRNSAIFEIVPITKPEVMQWLAENKMIYLYPPRTQYEWMSKETGLVVPEAEVSQVNGGCYYGEVTNTQEYTSIPRDFEMFNSYQDIKHYFWRKNEDFEVKEFQKCVDFMRDELTVHHCIVEWNEVYGHWPVSMEDAFLLKKALLVGNKTTCERLKQAHDIHTIMWAVYVATNHEFYWNSSFGTLPDEDDPSYTCFFQNLVNMFVEEGLAKELLWLAISGARQRDVGKTRDYHNILHENALVVKLLIPAHFQANEVIHDDLTAWQHWNTYDNTLYNYRSMMMEPCEEFARNQEIGEFLRPTEQSTATADATATATADA